MSSLHQAGQEFDTPFFVSIRGSNVKWEKSVTSTTSCVKSGYPICAEAAEGADDSAANSFHGVVVSIVSELERIRKVAVEAGSKCDHGCPNMEKYDGGRAAVSPAVKERSAVPVLAVKAYGEKAACDKAPKRRLGGPLPGIETQFVRPLWRLSYPAFRYSEIRFLFIIGRD